MKIAILGLPLSGKTTLFRALAAGHYSGGGEAHLASVAVPDWRLDVIAERERPKKKTYAAVTFVDVGAMRTGEDTGARLDKLHSLTGDADALLLVVQAFGDLDHAGRPLDVARDLRDLLAEILLTDMAIVERRLERVSKEHRSKRKGEQDPEYDLLQRLRAHLDAERWARELVMSDEETNFARGYGLLTLRPALVVFNVAEDDLEGQKARAAGDLATSIGFPWEIICADLELQFSELSDEERPAFLAEYGLQAAARERLISAAYRLLDIVTFFTVNENEARAWTVPRGTTARQAAGKIHSDMEKGFVRAETIAFADYERTGNLHDAHKANKVRLEGKDYIVQDGDILLIRFTR